MSTCYHTKCYTYLFLFLLTIENAVQTDQAGGCPCCFGCYCVYIKHLAPFLRQLSNLLVTVTKNICAGESNSVQYRSRPDSEVIKLFSCSTQLSMKIFQLINVKMPTIVGILTFMSGKNSILGFSEPKKSRIS